MLSIQGDWVLIDPDGLDQAQNLCLIKKDTNEKLYGEIESITNHVPTFFSNKEPFMSVDIDEELQNIDVYQFQFNLPPLNLE